MLILTRRTGESVKIGDDITVTVLGIRHGQVRIGITAPKNIAVHREEVYERLRSANNASVNDGAQAAHRPTPEATPAVKTHR